MGVRSPSGTRTSVSSLSLFQGCQRRWKYYKVDKLEQDPDNSPSNALEVGSAFHLVQEETGHDLKHIDISPLTTDAEIFDVLTSKFKKMCIEKENLQEKDWPMVAALSVGYWKQRLARFPHFKCVAVERELLTEDFIGYVDCTFVDEKKKGFWIIDLKTAGYGLDSAKIKMLRMNPQLNLYAYFQKILAEASGIPDLPFLGVGYFSVVKPKIKQRSSESDKDFYLRLLAQTERYENNDLITLPREELNPVKARNLHKAVHKQMMDVRAGKKKAIPNYNYCFQYFRPCPYFSKCHGSCV